MFRARICRVPIIVSAAAVVVAVSQSAYARALTVEDYYRLVTLQAPAMSPDGRWVAFIKTTIVEAENRRQNEL